MSEYQYQDLPTKEGADTYHHASYQEEEEDDDEKDEHDEKDDDNDDDDGEDNDDDNDDDNVDNDNDDDDNADDDDEGDDDEDDEDDDDEDDDDDDDDDDKLNNLQHNNNRGPPPPHHPYYPYPYGYPMAPPAYAPPSLHEYLYTGTQNPHAYTDASSMGDPPPDTRRNRGGVTEPFPEKLHRMLDATEREGVSDVVSFFSHGRAFAIHKPRRFVSETMPRFFRQTRLTSFQRQLNLYGFRRVSQGPDNGGYYHELFLKGRPGLCVNMKRTKVKGTQKLKRDPDTEPNFYAMRPVTAGGIGPSPTSPATGPPQQHYSPYPPHPYYPPPQHAAYPPYTAAQNGVYPPYPYYNPYAAWGYPPLPPPPLPPPPLPPPQMQTPPHGGGGGHNMHKPQSPGMSVQSPLESPHSPLGSPHSPLGLPQSPQPELHHHHHSLLSPESADSRNNHHHQHQLQHHDDGDRSDSAPNSPA